MEKEIFVPGRLCLFGEHSDWAGGHRRQNSELERGYAIVCQTNQGNYAKVKKLDDAVLKFNSKAIGNSVELKLEQEELKRIAEEGDVFSYVAGVALDVVSNYSCKGGVEIDNYRSDLPLKKGLSSSASICVLTATAFNEIFELKWTRRRIMDIAYNGETNTPSGCGRMDQACAYDKPILMIFDRNKIEAQELKIGRDIPILVADLKKGKDTQRILTALNQGFPFPQSKADKPKMHYLGPINRHIVERASNALRTGDVKRLGNLMTEAQEGFDYYVAPACPDQLGEKGSPKLHEILRNPKVQEFVYGGKGVGSQGDGAIQFVCKSQEARTEARKILEEEELDCFDLDLKKNF